MRSAHFMRTLLLVLIAPALLAPLGCAAGDRTTPATLPPRAATPEEARAVVILDGHSGAPTTWQHVVRRAAEADFVLLGETHGHPVGLPFAAELWSDVLKQSPDAALALEFFERDEQSRMDDYLAGVTDEETFQKRTRRTPGSYPEGHRAMLEAAKAAGRPVIAANAPRPYVRYARTHGYEQLAGLKPEQTRLFRVPEYLPTGRYRAAFVEIMSSMPSHGSPAPAPKGGAKSAAAGTTGDKSHRTAAQAAPSPRHADAQARPSPHHAASQSSPHHARAETPASDEPTMDSAMEAGFRSQSLWDWTMADSIAAAARAGQRPVFLVVGRFHVEHEGGLVQALRSLHPGASPVTLTVRDEASAALREKDRGAADFVVYAGRVNDE